jgi:isoquinoline 1-oxidoreductase beta subunit
MKQDLNQPHLVPDVDLPAPILESSHQAPEVPHAAGDPTTPRFDRRSFLKLSGIAGGGLVLAFHLRPAKAHAASPEEGTQGTFSPNAFVQVKPDGTIILAAKNPEIGQGIKTAFPMIIAEELEVPWEQVTVIQSRIDAEAFGNQFAGGSQSVPQNWDRLRQAGAVARTMLVTAAANQWDCPESDCYADSGSIHHRPSGKHLAYGGLAAAAAALPIPEADSVRLKERKDYKLLGSWIPGVDNHDLVTGKQRFGIDQQLPGMVYATYVKCPQFGGKVKSANLDQVKAMPGVTDAFILEGNGNLAELMPGVAIIADSTYGVFQAAGQLRVDWDTETACTDSWSGFIEQAKAITADSMEKVSRESGDLDKAFTEAEKTLEAYYQYPFVAHATLEPQNCTAWHHDGIMEIWAPTQTPGWALGLVAGIAGLPPDKILMHQLRVGGGFGRRLLNDYMCEVVAIAKKVDAPVKLMWTREADMTHDFYRVGGFHKMKASVDKKGNLSGWHGKFVTFTEGEKTEDSKPVRGGGMGSWIFPYGMVPNIKLEETILPLGVPCGWWRAPGSCSLAFAIQGFLHEVSTAAGKDHRDFLVELMGERRWTGDQQRNNLNTGRAIDVINLAAEKGDWGKPLPEGHGRGIAFYFSHAGHFAEVAEVSVDENKKVTVHRVVMAGDVGLIINRSGAENQCEGSIVDGLSTMAGQEITFENGAVKETNYHNYPLLRMPNTPKIEVYFIESDFPPTGLGEPALPPLAPAVCNAIFDATGHRIRTLPMTKEGFRV